MGDKTAYFTLDSDDVHILIALLEKIEAHTDDPAKDDAWWESREQAISDLTDILRGAVMYR